MDLPRARAFPDFSSPDTLPDNFQPRRPP
jgi:hypothetical protein